MLDKLPLVPLVRVFSYIDDFSDKIALERVCKQWRPLIWEKTKTCPVPMQNDMEALGLVLNRCGDQLEELWLQSRLKWPQNVWQIDEKLINQMGRRMNSLKHLKISNCRLDGPAVNSIADLFGQQLYSFILDNTPYHPNMRRLIENESSKLEHLQIDLTPDYSTGTLPTKLLNNLKSFSLRTLSYDLDSSLLLLNIARDCKNLKILHLQIDTLFLPNMIWAIGNIKSLVYLNLDTNSIQNEAALINVICHELPNLKALHIGGYYSKKIVSNICRDRPDLVHLNVFTRHPFQISDSLNSLTLRISMLNKTADLRQFLPSMLFNQSNKSIQHLDIRSLRFPSSSNFIKKLLGQFPDLKSIHWKMPMDAANANLTSFFALIEKHLENGRKIKIYFHHDCPRPQYYPQYCKYILPDDLAQFEAGWRPKLCNGKCENLVLKKLIKEAVDGGNEPSFLDDLWME